METLIKQTETFSSELIESGLKTEIAVELVKKEFANNLSNNLSLYKVTSPIFVEENTGINDDLNGVERAISFPVKSLTTGRGVVIHSLAKWKRLRLMELRISPGEGILTDMRAIRPDEDLSEIHSIFVDQWDWERVISKEQRTIEFLKQIVDEIYDAMKKIEQMVFEYFPAIAPVLPDKITFIHSQELLEMYPDLSPKEREYEAAKKFGAFFLIGIGADLTNGMPHDGRAPDYDDWSTATDKNRKGLNGDIIVWNPSTQSALELSSMGIRVDKDALMRQLTIKNDFEKAELSYHKMLMNDKLPLSIGGGIGQSRLCMFFLRKRHIGEVQASIWPQSIKDECAAKNINIIGLF